jgi:hypothetical protein
LIDSHLVSRDAAFYREMQPLTNLRSTTLAGRTRARLGARVRQAADVERQICARQRAGATAGSAEQSGGSIVAWSRSVTHEAVAVAGQVRRHLLIIFHPNTLQSPSLPLCLLTYLTAPWVAGCPWRSHPPSLLSLTPCIPRMRATPQTAPRRSCGDPISKSVVMAETGRLPIQA